MDKLEPVATVIGEFGRCVDGDRNTSDVLSCFLEVGTEVYTLPDTHRIVSVELLEACMRECYMPEDDLRDRIGAIIDQE